MNKAIRPLLIIGSAWILLVCGCGYLSLMSPGLATRWKQEPPPPESISRLALGKAGEALAYTSNGTLYEFHYGTYRTPSTWTKVSEPSGSPAIGRSCFPEGGMYLILPPPGKAVSRVSENCAYMESGYHLEVALLENGEVWSWEYERYAYTELFIMFLLLVAFAMGIPFFVMGLVLKVAQKVKKIAE